LSWANTHNNKSVCFDQYSRVHIEMVAEVLQQSHIDKEYSALSYYHDDPAQDINALDETLTTVFFLEEICPALTKAWGRSFSMKDLFEAIMTDGMTRTDPWTKVSRYESSLGAMKRANSRISTTRRADAAIQAEAARQAESAKIESLDVPSEQGASVEFNQSQTSVEPKVQLFLKKLEGKSYKELMDYSKRPTLPPKLRYMIKVELLGR
jgi:hypothetical protein